jgi:hypothetical protein
VIVLATLGAPERRLLGRSKTRREAPPEPDPIPVTTNRVTVVDVGDPLESEAAARAWLERAGEDELAQALAVLNRALHAYRVVTADPHLHEVGRERLLAARLGYGAGEQVADGLWTAAQELLQPRRRQRRSVALQPQAHLAAILTGNERVLACQELTLRARLDLEQGRPRVAALQVLVALDAALAELSGDSAARSLGQRIDELRGRRDAAAHAAQAALSGELPPADLEATQFTLRRIEAALRARAVASA